MRISLFRCGLLLTSLLVASQSHGEDAVKLATHTKADLPQPEIDTQAIDRIRRIVLSQGEDARALANLVQLTRTLPAASTCQLYYQLSTDYLQQGKYNQAASLLQQLLIQYPKQEQSRAALLRLVRLYCSSEVTLTQTKQSKAEEIVVEQAGFAKYGSHLASSAILANQSLANDPALTFQRAIAIRHEGRQKAFFGALTRIKRDRQAEPWRTRALAENWLTSDRKEDAPLAVLQCQRSEEHPHLDGVLDEPFWQTDQPVQFAYNDAFLYLAASYPKQKALDYSAPTGARTYDADLSEHDRVQLMIDLDRDYATGYQLTVDHRGWTNDRCWLETGWNPKWFVAAASNNTHWSVEAAIPFEALANPAPQLGAAWVVSTQRLLPGKTANSTRDSAAESFQVLLFQ